MIITTPDMLIVHNPLVEVLETVNKVLGDERAFASVFYDCTEKFKDDKTKKIDPHALFNVSKQLGEIHLESLMPDPVRYEYLNQEYVDSCWMDSVIRPEMKIRINLRIIQVPLRSLYEMRNQYVFLLVCLLHEIYHLLTFTNVTLWGNQLRTTPPRLGKVVVKGVDSCDAGNRWERIVLNGMQRWSEKNDYRRLIITLDEEATEAGSKLYYALTSEAWRRCTRSCGTGPGAS